MSFAFLDTSWRVHNNLVRVNLYFITTGCRDTIIRSCGMRSAKLTTARTATISIKMTQYICQIQPCWEGIERSCLFPSPWQHFSFSVTVMSYQKPSICLLLWHRKWWLCLTVLLGPPVQFYNIIFIRVFNCSWQLWSIQNDIRRLRWWICHFKRTQNMMHASRSGSV